MREKDVDIGYALLAHKIIITFGFSHKDLTIGQSGTRKTKLNYTVY